VPARDNPNIAGVYAEWQKLSERGVDTNAMPANGLNHPVAVGHRISRGNDYEVDRITFVGVHSFSVS